MPKFNNTPNKCITSTGGEQYWISRSCAVVVVVIAITYNDNEKYVLVNQRGTGTMDFPGLWNVPCGYLDWNETSSEAAIREVYEETGVDIFSLRHDGGHLDEHMNQPWYVQTDPQANRQNVSLRHGIVIQRGNFSDLPSVTADNSEPDEIADIRWANIKDLDKYEFAFEHKNVIEEYLQIAEGVD